MISLFVFEVKKLIRSRSFLLLFALLMCANLLICFISATNGIPENEYEALIQEDYAESGYKQDVERVISSAKTSLKSNLAAGYDENGYICGFQKQVIETYSRNIDISITKELVVGWKELIFYNFDFVLVAILVIFAAAFLLLQDDNNATRGIVRATKNGRLRLFITRLFALFTVTLLAELVFFAASAAVMALTSGFSDWQVSVQSIRNLALCPFNISVAGAAAVMLCMKVIALSVVLLVSAILCGVICNSVFSMLGSVIFSGLSYMTSVIYSSSSNAFLNVINIFSLSNGKFFLQRLYGIRIFDSSVDPIAVAFGIILILICLLPLAYWFYAGKNAKSKARRLNVGLLAPKTILAFELKKIFSLGTVCLLAALILTKTGICLYSYYFDNIEDTVYQSYMETLAGPITDEKKEYIASEKAHISDTIMQRPLYDAMFNSDMISGDEYKKYIEEYNICTFKEKVFPKIEERAKYIEENGNVAWFVYDNGYNRLFTAEADYLCIIIVILICSDLFAKEYSTGMFKIISATKNGRSIVTRIKLISVLSFVFIFTCLFNLMDHLWVSAKFVLPMWDAPACSLPYFCGINQLSIGEFYIISLACKALLYICFGLLVVALSKSTKNQFYTVASIIGVCCVPHVAYLLGIEPAGILSLPLMMSVSGSIISFGLGLFMIIMFIILIIASSASFIALKSSAD